MTFPGTPAALTREFEEISLVTVLVEKAEEAEEEVVCRLRAGKGVERDDAWRGHVRIIDVSLAPSLVR
jgi:hypothetical protein